MRPKDFTRIPAAAAVSAVDADAAAIIADILAAGGTLSNADRAAINTFVVGAKAANLYSRIVDGTLIMGGTAGAVAVDFVRHGQQVITTFTGPPTITANGMQGDSATMWATLYQNADLYNITNMAVDVLVGTNDVAGTTVYDYGVANAAFTQMLQIRTATSANGGNVVSGDGTGSDFVTSTGVTDTRGMHTLDRSGNTLTYYYRGAAVGTRTPLAVSTMPALRPTLLARNHNATTEGRTSHLLQFYCTRESFSPIDTATWYSLVYQLQVAIGRNTY